MRGERDCFHQIMAVEAVTVSRVPPRAVEIRGLALLRVREKPREAV
jgi:hypothetical protein